MPFSVALTDHHAIFEPPIEKFAIQSYTAHHLRLSHSGLELATSELRSIPAYSGIGTET